MGLRRIMRGWTDAAITIGFVATGGVALAWLVMRTDLPMKGLIANISIIPYIMPS